jgi:hypothetical protein
MLVKNLFFILPTQNSVKTRVDVVSGQVGSAFIKRGANLGIFELDHSLL